MRMLMHYASGPSFQGIKNGQPYNKWVGTITLVGNDLKTRCKKYFWEVSGDTPEEVEAMLTKYRIGEPIKTEFELTDGKWRVQPCKHTKK